MNETIKLKMLKEQIEELEKQLGNEYDPFDTIHDKIYSLETRYNNLIRYAYQSGLDIDSL